MKLRYFSLDERRRRACVRLYRDIAVCRSLTTPESESERLRTREDFDYLVKHVQNLLDYYLPVKEVQS